MLYIQVAKPCAWMQVLSMTLCWIEPCVYLFIIVTLPTVGIIAYVCDHTICWSAVRQPLSLPTKLNLNLYCMQLISVFNGCLLPREFVVQLTDQDDNPTPEPNVRVQLMKESGLKVKNWLVAHLVFGLLYHLRWKSSFSCWRICTIYVVTVRVF